MNNRKKLNEAEKEDFYSHLNMEDTTDASYTHAKRVWELGVKRVQIRSF